jgi:eukaryotic-like serine/threonine-protein kinase
MSKTISKIGKFSIAEKIGKGSMGTVYRAYDPYMKRNVAIKVTDPKSLADENIRQRLVELFFTEAQIYGLLDHRNILPVYDAGQDGDLHYLVMEYIENSRTLHPYCTPGNLLPVPKAVELLYQCCKGLQYAHSRSVIHLDIKPGNIMLTPDDTVRLADFGLAKILHPDTDYLRLDHILGTPTHISPERLRREPVNHQADIYSLGVVMFGLLTGHRPFSSKNLRQLIGKILEDEAPLLRQYRSDVPDILEPIVKKAMAKNVKDRFRSAADMARDLNAIHKKLVHAVVTTDIGTREKLERLKKLRFFRDFFEIELSEVINAGEWLEYSTGQMIISEGDLDDSFYVIIDGGVSVSMGRQVIAALRAGGCFGEMAYISKRPRIASVRAKSDTTVLKISNEMLESISVYCQLKFTKVFLNTLARQE